VRGTEGRVLLIEGKCVDSKLRERAVPNTVERLPPLRWEKPTTRRGAVRVDVRTGVTLATDIEHELSGSSEEGGTSQRISILRRESIQVTPVAGGGRKYF
jgi:hypothetical protein